LTNDNPCHWVGVKEKMIENHWNKSDKANEVRQKISESKLGVKLNLSLEQRKNRSLTHLAERNNMFGKTHTDEVKAVLSNLKSKTYKLINIFNNQEIYFWYNHYLFNDTKYYWINVVCPKLKDIRQLIGLAPTHELTYSPDGRNSFHITIANMKGI
jgi:hypothetical protein